MKQTELIAKLRSYSKTSGYASVMIKAADEIERLRDWIRHDGEANDTCTFYVLGEVCNGCACPRKGSNA